MGGIKRLPTQHAELHHLEGHEAGLLQVPREVLEHVAQDGHLAVVSDQLQVLQEHEVHQRRERVRVVREGRLPVLLQILVELALVEKFAGVPLKAEFEVNLVDALPAHLLLHGFAADAPTQALAYLLGLDDALLDLLALHASALRIPEGLADNVLLAEASVQMPRNEAQRSLSVVLQVCDQVAELFGVHQRLGLVCPLTLRQGLRQLVGNDAGEHQVVEAAWQLLTHDCTEVMRHLRSGGSGHEGPQRPHLVLWHVIHRRALHQHLANAVPVNMVILHLLRGERLHPVDQWGLLDNVNCSVKIESSVAWCRLEVSKVKEGVRKAILCASQQTSIYELILADLPLGQDNIKINPVNPLVEEINVDDDPRDAVKQETGRAKHCLYYPQLAEVCELGACKIRCLQHFAAFLLQVVKDEVYKVTVDAAGGNGKTPLRLNLLAQHQVSPGSLHLLVHATDKHRVLRAGRHALEHKDGRNIVPSKQVQLLVDKAEDPRWDATKSICKGVLQELYGPKPIDCVDADSQPAQGL
mmetsp:Transcript_1668/g.5180  ORF Transcript_1668/g.5180 Transcript_1668/m.5180 type:complete len:526 (-) Transcript_1668:110-1687(-)